MSTHECVNASISDWCVRALTAKTQLSLAETLMVAHVLTDDPDFIRALAMAQKAAELSEEIGYRVEELRTLIRAHLWPGEAHGISFSN